MSKKILTLIQAVLLLVVIALVVAVVTGNAVGRPAPQGRSDVLWVVRRGYIPAEPAIIMSPPHYICFNPSEC